MAQRRLTPNQKEFFKLYDSMLSMGLDDSLIPQEPANGRITKQYLTKLRDAQRIASRLAKEGNSMRFEMVMAMNRGVKRFRYRAANLIQLFRQYQDEVGLVNLMIGIKKTGHNQFELINMVTRAAWDSMSVKEEMELESGFVKILNNAAEITGRVYTPQNSYWTDDFPESAFETGIKAEDSRYVDIGNYYRLDKDTGEVKPY